MKKVAVIMGSKSDWPVVKKAVDVLWSLGVKQEVHIMSAHRTPQVTAEFAQSARDNGFGVIIAAAGMSAHLAGVIASMTTLPVIALPLKSAQLEGLDALLSVVQMPPGIPVATVGIGGAGNAAILAAEILAVNDDQLSEKLLSLREKNAQKVMDDDKALTAEVDSKLNN